MPRSTTKTNVPRPPVPALRGAKLIFTEAIASDEGVLESVVGRVLAAVQQVAALDGHAAAIEIALREALANAILHGNGRDPRKTVKLDCYRQKGKGIVLVVRDQGRGFNPAVVPDPTEPENIFRTGGRGIFLIRHFMDEVGFRQRGSEIRMRKKL